MKIQIMEMDYWVTCHRRAKGTKNIFLNPAFGSNGGDPDKTSFTLKFEVDYVCVYQTVN